MCGRFTQKMTWREIHTLYRMPQRTTPLNLVPRYNGCPTQDFAVCRLEGSDRAIAKLRWGLIPPWAKDPAIGARLINARAETVHEKPAFRAAFRSGSPPAPGSPPAAAGFPPSEAASQAASRHAAASSPPTDGSNGAAKGTASSHTSSRPTAHPSRSPRCRSAGTVPSRWRPSPSSPPPHRPPSPASTPANRPSSRRETSTRGSRRTRRPSGCLRIGKPATRAGFPRREAACRTLLLDTRATRTPDPSTTGRSHFCTRLRGRSGTRERPGVERIRDASVAPALERGGEGAGGTREFEARGAHRRSGPALRALALVVVDVAQPRTSRQARGGVIGRAGGCWVAAAACWVSSGASVPQRGRRCKRHDARRSAGSIRTRLPNGRHRAQRTLTLSTGRSRHTRTQSYTGSKPPSRTSVPVCQDSQTAALERNER